MIPKNPWNQPNFPRFQVQLNLIHQKEKKHNDKQIRKKIKSNSDTLRLWIAIVIVWRSRGEEFAVEKLGIREMEVESVMIALR
jgi:hypothetical protein